MFFFCTAQKIIKYANRSYIQNIGTEFCVQECDIAQAYDASEDTQIYIYI